ncbi:MAG: transglutaminase-like domain-containing protein [Paludibacter sp.]|nr:transglutaminase-like domain-containing protein [Paludibacter sp.]
MVHIQNIEKLIHRNGDTDDIIKVVMMAYNVERDPQIRQIAEKLRGKDVYETCKNIWEYLLNNIRYVPDTGKQKIKTPARLIHDGVGDCKSYSLFTAVVLRFLNIEHVFRFVSYNSRKEATHVYVVAFHEHGTQNTEREIKIDAVASNQIKLPFNEEVNYNFKCDMSRGTEIYYVAGLAGNTKRGPRSTNRIGSALDYSIWIGNDNQSDITPGKYYLYGQYDLISEMIRIARSKKETDFLYTQLTIITAFIAGYNFVNGDNKEFDRIARIISFMIRNKNFDISQIAESNRNNWFDAIIENIISNYNANTIPVNIDADWYNLIVSKVINDNELSGYVNGIGKSKSLDILAPTLKKAGIYFIYTFIPDNKLSEYDPKVAKKRTTQLFFLNLIDKVDIFHKRETLIAFFRSGIISRVGMQPEEYIKSVKEKNVKIGALPAALVTIGAIISIIIGLIEIIKAIWPKSAAADYAPSSGAAYMNNELYTLGKGEGKGKGKGKGEGEGKGEGKGEGDILKASMPWLLGGSLLFTLLIKNKK